jgi:transcriptional regulator with XRE-family HTH domain
MNPSIETIGDRARAAREARGFTQQEVTKRGGPSKPTLFRIESDPNYSPEDYTLERLALALQVNLHWLKTGEGLRDAPAKTYITTGPHLGPPAADARTAEFTTAQKLAAEVLLNAIEGIPDEELVPLLRAFHQAQEEARRARELTRKAEEGK